MDLQLNGKRALVSGSHRGTGRAIAHALAREGAHVLVHGFELDAAETVAALIAKGLTVATAKSTFSSTITARPMRARGHARRPTAGSKPMKRTCSQPFA